MNTGDTAAAISSFRARYVVRTADTPHLTREAHRLRHQVYCLERGYEPSKGGLEVDEFDSHAMHSVLCDRRSGEVLGAVRIILPAQQGGRSLPIQRVCPPALLDAIPFASTVEVSRFAVSKQRRAAVAGEDGLLRLGLVQGLVRLSMDLGLTHWCAIMERSLLRLLRATAIDFSPVGPCIEYHGVRQPAVADLHATLARMEREHPALWDLVTEDGRLWPSTLELSTAA